MGIDRPDIHTLSANEANEVGSTRRDWEESQALLKPCVRDAEMNGTPHGPRAIDSRGNSYERR